MTEHKDILTKFYEAIADNDENFLKKVHLPMSDVFYVQKAIYEKTGILYDLDHVERAMYLEGHLDAHDVLDPNRRRDWE